MEDYFEGYYQLQKTAIEIMTDNYLNEPMMEDYLSLLPNSNAQLSPETDLRVRFLENIQPCLPLRVIMGLNI